MPGTSINAGQIKGTLVLNGKQFHIAIDKAGKKTQKFVKGQKKGANNVANAWIKSFAKIAAAGAVTFAFRAIVKEGSALEAKFANVSTLGDITAETMADMEEQVRSLSSELRKAPVDLTEGLYQAISAGATAGADALDVLEVSAKLATAGLSTTETAVDAVTNATNVYGKETLSSARAANLMLKVVQKGKTTLSQFAPQIGKVASLAESLGVSFDEVSAASALLTKTMPTEQAITALDAAMRGLTKASDKFAAAGVDIFALLEEEGLAGALEKLQELTGGNVKAMSEWIPESQALKGVLSLVKDEVGAYNDLLVVMKDKTDVVNDAVAKQMDTTTSRTEGLKTAFKLLAATIFDEIQPAYDAFIVAGTKALEVSERLISSTDGLTKGSAKFLGFQVQIEELRNAGILTTQEAIEKLEAFKQAELLVAATAKENAEAATTFAAAKQKEIDDVVKSLDEKNELEKKANAATLLRFQTEIELDAFLAGRQKSKSEREAAALKQEKQENSAHFNWLAEQYDIDLKKQQDAEDKAFAREIKGLQDEAAAKIEHDKFLGEQFDIRLKKEQDAEDRAFQREIVALQEAQALREAWLGSWQTSLEGFQSLSSNIFGQVRDDFASTIADISVDLKFQADAMDEVWKSLQKSIISGLIKIGIQQIAQLALSKSLGVARTLASQAEAAAVGAAWASPAALASLGSFGANAIPAAAGITSTVALANALAIPTRKDGGPVSEGLTLTHDDEFVLSKSQTQQVSQLLTNLNERLGKLENNQTVVVKPKGDIAAQFFNWFNFEIETNKRRGVANVVV